MRPMIKEYPYGFYSLRLPVQRILIGAEIGRKMERFDVFVQSLKPEDNIAVFYHEACVDGLCSGVLVAKALFRLTGKMPVIHVPSPHEVNDKTIGLVREKKANKVFFVDLNPERFPEKVRELEQLAEVVIMDHHKFEKDLTSERTMLVHADKVQTKLDGVQYPASKLVYDTFSEKVKLDDVDWIACVGLVADMGYEIWKEFVQGVNRKYGFKEFGDVTKTVIISTSRLLSKGNMFPKTESFLFDVVYNAKEPAEILENTRLLEYEKIAREEITFWLGKANEAEVNGDLVMFEMRPKLDVCSTVSTMLSMGLFKNKTIIIIEDILPDKLLLSARDQRKKIKMNLLLKEAVRGLENATAGGHIPAAGGNIRKEDREVFKRRLREIYARMQKEVSISVKQ